jgi:hypothetical protein
MCQRPGIRVSPRWRDHPDLSARRMQCVATVRCNVSAICLADIVVCRLVRSTLLLVVRCRCEVCGLHQLSDSDGRRLCETGGCIYDVRGSWCDRTVVNSGGDDGE